MSFKQTISSIILSMIMLYVLEIINIFVLTFSKHEPILQFAMLNPFNRHLIHLLAIGLAVCNCTHANVCQIVLCFKVIITCMQQELGERFVSFDVRGLCPKPVHYLQIKRLTCKEEDQKGYWYDFALKHFVITVSEDCL